MSEPFDLTPTGARSRRRQIATTVVLAVGLIGLGVAARETLRDSQGVSLPGPAALAGAVVLTRAALSCSARAWVLLIGPPADPYRLRGTYYSSQLVKYLPIGGVAQAAGQMGLTATQGVPMRRVALAYASLVTATVAAGTTLGAGLVLIDDVPTAVRALAVLGLAGPALMDRRLLGTVLRRARRVITRLPEPELLPPQGALWRALGWSAANHLLYAAGFTALLRSVNPEVPLAATTVAFVVAWVAGFLVLPLPAGVGVREAALVALVPSVAAGPLLAASLAQRLVAMAAELAAALLNRVHRPRSS